MSESDSHLSFARSFPLGRVPRLRIVDRAVSEQHDIALDTPSSGLIWAQRYRTKLRLTDSAVIVLAVSVALVVRFGVNGIPAVPGSFSANYWLVSLLIVAAWLTTLALFHTRDSRVIGVGASEYKQVVNASVITFGMLAIAFLILHIDIARLYFVLALPIGIVVLVLERWLWRKWLLHQRKFGHYLSRVIVVGNREDVQYVVSQINTKSGAAYYIVGAALENGIGEEISAGERTVPIVSDFDNVASAAAAMGVDTVIVAGQPSGGSSYIRNLGWDLEGTSAELVLSSRLTDVAGPRIHFRPVDGLPLIHVEIPRFEGGRHALKRTLDVVTTGLAMLLLLPVLAVIAVLIKMDSPGPVLFRQQRCGRNGQMFRMIKFRSMVQSAEDDLAGLLDQNEAAGVLFKIRNDPRITRIGRVLRKYSLDELPQLWNIFVGEMSLVGPRPPLPEEVQVYETHVHRRLYIKPGLTGMWQVNGRSNLSWEDSVRLDLYYVENWSLAGDLMIIWRTFKTVIQPVGAY